MMLSAIMQARKITKNKIAQELSIIVRIYGHEFTIDLDGFISTPQNGLIGHMENRVSFVAVKRLLPREDKIFSQISSPWHFHTATGELTV